LTTSGGADGAGKLGGVVERFADLLDEVGPAVEVDALATAWGALEVRGLKADGELAALAEAAGLKIEGDGDGGDAGAEVLRAEFYGDAEERIARGGGEGFEAGFLRRRHASRAVSKSRTPRRE